MSSPKKLRLFQPGWSEKFGFVQDADRAKCTLCDETVVIRGSSVQRHYQSKHEFSLITMKEEDRQRYIKTCVAKYETQEIASPETPQEKRTSNYFIPEISKPAPDWEGTAVVKGEFKEMKLKDFKGKYLVFFFYPLDFTFVCPTEIIAFSDRVKEFHAINTEVVACSVDSPFTHLAWINTARKDGGLGPLNIPLLSDLTHQIAKDYGVYLEDLGHTLRGLFIVDDKGTLRQITMNDLPVGRSVEETLRLVQAFQFTDKHGEVCPAGWKPGGPTIIPTPEDKLKYFSKLNE